MNKVYVVCVGDYEDRHVIAVFDESQKHIAEKLVRVNGDVDSSDLEEFELNPHIHFPELPLWEVKLWTQNDDKYERVEKYEYGILNMENFAEPLKTQWEADTHSPYRVITVRCFAENADHALKIARSYYTRLLSIDIFNIAKDFTFRNSVDEAYLRGYGIHINLHDEE